jgi:hypothetical protein
MKWLAAGVTFVNVATVWALLMGMMARGLSTYIAAFSVLIALAAAAFAYAATRDPLALAVTPAEEAGGTPRRHDYNRIWFYLLAFCFGFFAFRGFCWILFLDGNNWKVQSANNLGDLALHITYIKTFASGVPLWPENPIHFLSNLRYPAGVDLFNSLLLLLGVELAHGFIWVGLVASVATFYALYRWGGAFGIAGFLFNGGLAGFQVVQTWKFIDYQGVPEIAWKSLPLSMFITQRGFLWALPAGLLLLYHWRTKYFPARPTDNPADGERGPLPLWLEIAIYSSMPFFHIHTFMALSIVAAFLFAIGDGAARKQLGLMAAIAFIPATFFVWTITDHFQARSMIEWQPGWVQNSGSFRLPFFSFWFVNFGIFIPIALALIATCIWRAAKSEERFRFKDHPSLAFLTPAVFIFLFACLVKTAPWEWDNIKLIIWAYLLVLPFLWSELIAHWSVPVRAAVCIALFFSGFVSLYGGLVGKENGYGIADRAELDAVGAVVQRLPKEARIATFPTYNHPVLLQGRKVVLGYPGHLWTQGFDYAPAEAKLKAVMNGDVGWKEHARELRARYLFWGREEQANYPASQRPWERDAQLVASGAWGAIYDLEARAAAAPLAP